MEERAIYSTVNRHDRRLIKQEERGKKGTVTKKEKEEGKKKKRKVYTRSVYKE